MAKVLSREGAPDTLEGTNAGDDCDLVPELAGAGCRCKVRLDAGDARYGALVVVLQGGCLFD
jgi:hypothetical protein